MNDYCACHLTTTYLVWFQPGTFVARHTIWLSTCLPLHCPLCNKGKNANIYTYKKQKHYLLWTKLKIITTGVRWWLIAVKVVQFTSLMNWRYVALSAEVAKVVFSCLIPCISSSVPGYVRERGGWAASRPGPTEEGGTWGRADALWEKLNEERRQTWTAICWRITLTWSPCDCWVWTCLPVWSSSPCL